MAILYRHTRLDKNEPFYIGIGKKINRAYTKTKRNKHWNHIVNMTEYEVEILFDDLTWEEACEKEKEFIKIYGRRDLGTGTLVNMTDGGEGVLGTSFFLGRNHKSETKEKMRQKRLGINISDKTKGKISQSKKGKKTNYPKNRNDSRSVSIVWEGIIYESQSEASRKLNIPISTLKRWLKKQKEQ